jgi:hypothetical protein
MSEEQQDKSMSWRHFGTSLWPFKTGRDDSFRLAEKSIYDQVGELPDYDYRGEVKRFNESRWRKGWVQNVVPSGFYAGIIGFAWGMFECRRGNVRHKSRPEIVVMYTLSCVGVSIATTLSHQLIMMFCSYKPKIWQPAAAGMCGGMSFSLAMSASSPQAALYGGFCIGAGYTALCLSKESYDERKLVNFFASQQQQDVDISRVTPEMQEMYRAWLFDHRPLEDTDMTRRGALLLERDGTDTRLDSNTFRDAMQLHYFDDYSFPDWWPFKFQPPTKKESLLEQRMRDDMHERRRRAILSDDQVMMKHPLRTETAKQLTQER